MERFLRRLECDGFLVQPPGLKPETKAYLKREWEFLCRRSVARKPERTVPGRTADTGEPHGQSAV
ncbi:MAG TPA: hypothetical protein DCP92_00555, partial [Nitrospiraceae bacterium]|nr:hypothetical protein [Nitrospiraceae bacterium]